jgi:glyoxylase-like metal-dependent hydrolase (beta-lactamase superfamily II)
MTPTRPDVHVIRVPARSSDGLVNAYLIPGEMPTLVDTGPDSPAGREALEAGLAAAGLAFRDVRQIIVTHAHPNHGGLAGWLQAHNGARVTAHPGAIRALADWPATCAARADLLVRAAVAGNVPPALADAARGVLLGEVASVSPLHPAGASPARMDGPVRAGSGEWTILPTPGHTRDHVCVLHPTGGVLLVGDLLLRDAAPPPCIEARREDGTRPGTMRDLIASLRRAGDLPVRIAWPGHGRPIRAHRMLVARRLAAARARLLATLAVVRAGADTLWSVVQAHGADPDPVALGARLGEAVADLDWLVVRGRVLRTVTDGTVRFTPARRSPGR